MAKTKVIELSDGRKVKCRRVPVLAYRGAMRKSALQFPPPPIIEVKVQKGTSTEKVPAPEGTPEWEEYQQAMSEVSARREAYQEQFAYSYGVAEWSEDGEKWSTSPPRGWKLDDIMVEMMDLDMKNAMVKRAAFIMYDLLCDPTDHNKVQNYIFAGELEPVLAEEVQAAEDGF